MSQRIPGTAQAINLYPDYFTFTFLRNPYVRFVSLWLDLQRVARERRGEPGGAADGLATLRGFAELAAEVLADFGPCWGADAAPVNPAERARSVPLAAAAKLAAWALRTLGARRLLQALKDDPRVVGLVFPPLDPAELPALGAACRAAVEAASERLGEGLWLVRAAQAPNWRRQVQLVAGLPGIKSMAVIRRQGGCRRAAGH